MVRRRAVVTWDEQDAYTRWRQLLCRFNRAGAVKSVKRGTHRRERREGKRRIRAGEDD